MATTPVFLSEKSHGQRSLVGYSPRGHKESDMIEQLSTHAWTVAHWLLFPRDPPVKSTEVHCHFLHQGISPTHGSNLTFFHFLH